MCTHTHTFVNFLNLISFAHKPSEWENTTNYYYYVNY